MSNNPNNFYVIPQLRLCDGELLCKPNGKRALREVHFQQGTLDGACGVYSFLMALGILGVFEPRNITVDRMKDLPAKEQGFVRELHKHGLYRKGLYGEEIKGLLESHYRSRIQVDYVEKENKTEEFLQTVLDSLEGGSPCILGISNRRRKLGHWVLSVGYQYDSDTDLLGFLILDPGVSSPKMMLWNGMLNLVSDGSKCEYLTIDSHPEDILTVEIEDAIIISRKSKLNSTCKCNRILINNLFKFFVWREVSKSFTRSIIEFIFNPLNLFVGYFTKVLTLWDILPDKPVGVFIGTTFP